MRLQQPVDRADQSDEVIDGPLALFRTQLEVLADPFQFVDVGVLGFLFPMEKKDVLEQGREVLFAVDAQHVVRLGEELDEIGQSQNGPGALREDRRGDFVRPGKEAVALGHRRGRQALDAAEELLVLEFLVAETDQRLQRDLVAGPVLAADLQDLAVDEAFDKAEHIGVGTALDLAQEQPLRLGEELKALNPRKSVRQVFLGRVESASADDVFIDVPADFLRRDDAAFVICGGGGLGDLHVVASSLVIPIETDALWRRMTRLWAKSRIFVSL